MPYVNIYSFRRLTGVLSIACLALADGGTVGGGRVVDALIIDAR